MGKSVGINILLVFFSLVLLAPGAGAQSSRFQKVFIVVLENTSYSKALNQPYLSKLIKQGALLSNYSAIRHPSYPNYLALTSGSTQGKVADNVSVISAKHIGDLLEAKGKSWKNYAEDLTPGCSLKNLGRFAPKHVPFLSYADVRKDLKYCASHVVDASTLEGDIQNGSLPDYSFYSPNLDNDGHDTQVGFASTWLEQTFGPRFLNPKFMKDMLFVLTFDEDEGFSPQNRVLTILLGDSVVPSSQTQISLNHYSLLRTIEDVMNLGSLGAADKSATPISGIWK